MQKQNYLSLVCFLSISLGTSAMAQQRGDHHYNGPDHGVNRSNNKASNDSGCMEKYGKMNQPQLLNTCLMGATSAVQMASRYATSEGRMDGYRRGYAWGLRSEIDANINNPNEVIAGKSSVNANTSPALISKLGTADNAGGVAGKEAGTPSGDREAITRFHNAIDTGKFPSKGVSDQQANAYNPQYSSPYSNPYIQTVGGEFTEMDLLNDNRIDYSNVNPYQNYDTDLYGSRPDFDHKGFYVSNGQYDFDGRHAEDGRKAFDIWLDRSVFDRDGYSQLGTVSVITGYTTQTVTTTTPANTVTPVTPVRPVTGPGAGHPGGGQVVVIHPTPVTPPTTTTSTVQVPVITVYDLKQVFAAGFISSYEQTSPYFYSNAFNDNLDVGDNAGAYVGQQIGQRLAFQNGQVSEYNSEFRSRESNSFWSTYQAEFRNSFASTYNRYATTPQLGVDSFTIKAVRNDGFVEPGEGITASFVIHNYGGVDANVQTSLDGNVVNSTALPVRVKALTSSRQVGSLSATIDPNVPSQSEANVVLIVDNNSIPLQQYVTRQITIDNASYGADMAHGNVQITMNLKNNSSVKSYDAVKLLITDSLNRVQTVQLGLVDVGSVPPTNVNLSGFNALDLIDGKISVRIDAYLGSMKVGTSTLAISTDNVNNQLALAFDATADGKGAVSSDDISNRLYEAIHTEALASGRTGYKNEENTLLSNLVNVKRSHPQSSAAETAYSNLSDTLSPIENEMAKALIHMFHNHSDNQNYFAAQMSILAE